MRAAAVALAVALVACGGGRRGPSHPTGPLAVTLAAADGGEIATAAYRGKVVVLHVFTTWSLAATADVDQLRAAHARGGDVVVIGVALDLEGFAVVAPWRAALGVDYLVALADDAFRDGATPLGKIAAVPTTIVLDRRGRVARWIDRELAAGELAAAIDGALAAR